MVKLSRTLNPTHALLKTGTLVTPAKGVTLVRSKRISCKTRLEALNRPVYPVPTATGGEPVPDEGG